MTSPTLTLRALRRDAVIVAEIGFGDQVFEVNYFASSPPSVTRHSNSMVFTREEFVLQQHVERFARGELVDLPVEIIVPDELPPKVQRRRWSFFDTPAGKALLARAAA